MPYHGTDVLNRLSRTHIEHLCQPYKNAPGSLALACSLTASYDDQWRQCPYSMGRSTVSPVARDDFSERSTEKVGADIVSRQLGQLFMMGFDGTVVNDQIRTLITVYHVGSILLTAKNFECAVSPFLLYLLQLCDAPDTKSSLTNTTQLDFVNYSMCTRCSVSISSACSGTHPTTIAFLRLQLNEF